MDSDIEASLSMAVPPLQSLVPYMSKRRFADIVGIEISVVDGWVEKGHLPSVLIGKYRLINVAKLWQQALEQ
jgi:hypothetical protein